MKLMFTSLICHRDVSFFVFNWFCGRSQLNKGFDIPHLLLNDGSLDESDIQLLQSLPNVILDLEPIKTYPSHIHKSVLFAKLECLERAIYKYNADRVILFDCDIFFLKPWDCDLRDMCNAEVGVLRDWCSSIGPAEFRPQYKQVFGVEEDNKQPNCNTGVISLTRDKITKIAPMLEKHLNNPFIISEDQGIIFAAFYGELEYIEGIKCLINGAETSSTMWDWVLNQRGAHLMGLHTRPEGRKSLINQAINNLPDYLHLSQFVPMEKFVSYGLMEYGTYSFQHPLYKIPSTLRGDIVTDALYLHGGSYVKWKLPPFIDELKISEFNCLDTGIKENASAKINSNEIAVGSGLNQYIRNGELTITTENGDGSHLVFLNPRLTINKYKLRSFMGGYLD